MCSAGDGWAGLGLAACNFSFCLHVIAFDTVTLWQSPVAGLLFALWHPEGFYSTTHLSVCLVIIFISLSRLRLSRSLCPFVFFGAFARCGLTFPSLPPMLRLWCHFVWQVFEFPVEQNRSRVLPYLLRLPFFSSPLSFLRDLARLCWICLHIFLPVILSDVLFFNDLCHGSVRVFIWKLLVLFLSSFLVRNVSSFCYVVPTQTWLEVLSF